MFKDLLASESIWIAIESFFSGVGCLWAIYMWRIDKKEKAKDKEEEDHREYMRAMHKNMAEDISEIKIDMKEAKSDIQDLKIKTAITDTRVKSLQVKPSRKAR